MVTHTFLERSELVPVVITWVVRVNKERDNKITSVRNYFLIIYRKLGLTFLERSELVPVVTTSVKG